MAGLSLRQRFWTAFQHVAERPLIALTSRPAPLLRLVAGVHAAICYPKQPGLRRRAVRIGTPDAQVAGHWCDLGQTHPDPAKGRVILWLHGGAYVAGGAASHAHWVAAVSAAAGARGFLLDYRLAPEHPYPAAVDDAEAAFRALMALGYAPHQIAVLGDSAGGGLAFALLHRLRAQGLADPAALVTVSAWTDLTLSADSLKTNFWSEAMVPRGWLQRSARAYAAQTRANHPEISPLWMTLDRPAPPCLLLVGEDEMLRDDTLRMGQLLARAGTKVSVLRQRGVGHIWPIRTRLSPEAAHANDQIAAFLRQTFWPDAPLPTAAASARESVLS